MIPIKKILKIIEKEKKNSLIQKAFETGRWIGRKDILGLIDRGTENIDLKLIENQNSNFNTKIDEERTQLEAMKKCLKELKSKIKKIKC